MGVSPFAVGGVEGVIADHGQSFFRQMILDDMIEVLVVAPRQVDAVQPAARLVDAALGLIGGDGLVGVVLEELGENDLLRVSAADGERVADDGPLRLAEEAEDLAEVVNQPGQDEPARVAGGANGLGRLHQVLDLGQVGIRVAVVDQRVEELHRLPDPHLPVIPRHVLPLLGQDEVQRLIPVIQPVELPHRGADIRPVIPKRRRLSGLRIALLEERFPLIEAGQWIRLGRIKTVLRHTRSLASPVWRAPHGNHRTARFPGGFASACHNRPILQQRRVRPTVTAGSSSINLEDSCRLGDRDKPVQVA